MKKEFLLVALLGFGCSDVEAVAKLESAVIHGAVEAEITCAPTPNTQVVTGCSSGTPYTNYRLKISKLLDESYLVKYNIPNFGLSSTELISKGSPLEITEPMPSATHMVITIGEGDVTFVDEYYFCASYSTSGTGTITVDLGAVYCDGFNLEAFGVEE